MNKIIITGALLLALAGCHSSAPVPAAVPAAATGASAADSVKTYDAAILDNKKDPVCGMPSGAGMEDTLHIGGKVIGFCSKECKAAFLKSPKSYAVVYK